MHIIVVIRTFYSVNVSFLSIICLEHDCFQILFRVIYECVVYVRFYQKRYHGTIFFSILSIITFPVPFVVMGIFALFEAHQLNLRPFHVQISFICQKQGFITVFAYPILHGIYCKLQPISFQLLKVILFTKCES